LADQVTDNRTDIADGTSATNWEDIGGTALAVDTDIKYDTFSGSIGLYATTTRDGIFYNNTTTGLFASGDVAYILFNCGVVSLLDTKLNGGVTVRVTGATITDWVEFELFGSDEYPTTFDGGWAQIVVDIDELLASPTNTNGTPPTVANIQRFGITVITSSVMPRMTDNTWAGGFRILGSATPAIIVEGRDGGAADWNLASIAAVAAIQLSAVIKPGPGGSFVCRGPIQVGINDTSTHAFLELNKTLLFETQEVMVDGFYGLSALGNSGGTTNVTFGVKTGTGDDASGAQGGSIQAESTAARWFLDFDDPDVDGVNFYGVQCIHGGTFQLDDAAVSFISTAYIDVTLAVVSNSEQLKNQVIQPNTADGVALMQTDDLSDIIFCIFEFTDGHGIEILSGGPATQTNKGNIFNGAYLGTPGDNLVASSGSNDAMIYNNSTAAKTFNRSDGATQPSFRNGVTATSDDEATITLTFSPLTTGSEVAVFLQGTNTVVDSIESSGTSFAASASAGVAIDYKVILPGKLEIFTLNQTFSLSQTVNINQQIDRNFDPVDE
jgi:hypothetical protein